MTKTGIAAIIAAATLGAAAVTGAAVAMAADGTGPSDRASALSHDMDGPRGHGMGERGERGMGERGERGMGERGPQGRMLHSEGVVEDAEGAYTTFRMQSGEVTAASATSLTVTSADGYSSTYTLTDSTVVERDGADTAPRVGDTVHVRATVSGSTATAEHVHALSPERAQEMEDHREAMQEWMSERPEGHGGPGGPGRA